MSDGAARAVGVVNREALLDATATLAQQLTLEVKHLDRDAHAFAVRGYPVLAADLHSLRKRLTAVLTLAESVTATSGPVHRAAL